MNIKKLVTSVATIFKKLGNVDHDIDVLSSVITKAAPLVNQIYPIIEEIAKLTPSKTDDEILAAYSKFGFRNLFISNSSTSTQLRTLAVAALQNSEEFIKSSNISGPVPGYLINAALELAVSKLKETK